MTDGLRPKLCCQDKSMGGRLLSALSALAKEGVALLCFGLERRNGSPLGPPKRVIDGLLRSLPLESH